MNVMLKLAIVIAFGTIGARIARKFNMPNVTGYLILGLILGPSFLKVVTVSDMDVINFVNELALACIAFSIGGEFLISDIKKIGKDIFIITLGEVIGVLLLVFLIMFFVLGKSFAFSIIMAAMSASTAPAGTILVMRQYRAYGPLTKTILPITALDDALGIMVFGLAISLAKISMGFEKISFIKMIVGPIFQILVSLFLGLIIGIILSYIVNKVKNKDELLIIILCFIIGATGFSAHINLSPLLTNMMLGAVVINESAKAKKIFKSVNDFTPPINLLFFTLAGASLDLSILASIGSLGIIYVLSRALGKILGASLGAIKVGADEVIKKYLGIALLPQGGVAIGLSMIVSQEIPQFSSEIITLILFSVLVFEISGPILAKFAITKAGEVNGMDRRIG